MTFTNEAEIQEAIANRYNGSREVNVQGTRDRIDVLTTDYLIECKHFLTSHSIKKAIGQIDFYATRYPEKQKVVAGLRGLTDIPSAIFDYAKSKDISIWFVDDMFQVEESEESEESSVVEIYRDPVQNLHLHKARFPNFLWFLGLGAIALTILVSLGDVSELDRLEAISNQPLPNNNIITINPPSERTPEDIKASQRNRALSLQVKGDTYREVGDYDKAISLYAEAVELFAELGDHSAIETVQWSIKITSEKRDAKVLFESNKKRYSEAEKYQVIGDYFYAKSDFHAAFHGYDAAKGIYQLIGDDDRQEALQRLVDDVNSKRSECGVICHSKAMWRVAERL